MYASLTPLSINEHGAGPNQVEKQKQSLQMSPIVQCSSASFLVHCQEKHTSLVRQQVSVFSTKIYKQTQLLTAVRPKVVAKRKDSKNLLGTWITGTSPPLGGHAFQDQTGT
jgi:hypothetical protein